MDSAKARTDEREQERELESEERPGSCPLCGSEMASVVDRLTRGQIRGLWRTLGVELSERALESLGEGNSIELCRCGGCGFDRFPPKMAGGSAFYEELEAQFPNYYPETCPGFERAVAFAKRHGLKRIIDIGCGDGAFLDQVREAGVEAHGIELNPHAAEKAAQKGHKIYTERIESLLSQDRMPRFDLVTAFEVVEHVPDPVDFLQNGARLAQSGGYFAVTVPNRHGIHRLCQLEPHQWPPHHVTRWRAKDLRALAEQAGLQVVHIGGDRLHGAEIERYGELQQRFRRALGRRRIFGVSLLLRIASLGYRKTGCKFFFPGWGASLYGFFQV